MKIYRVIYESHDIDDADHTLNISTFFNKENAEKYLQECKESIKEQNEEFDLKDYTIEETEDSYEIYLTSRAFEQSVSVWLEEDETRDEISKDLKMEKENDYEIL